MQGTEGSVRVVAAGRGNVAVVVEMDGQTIELPALWLRERTRDPEAVDLRTEQRLFDPHRVDPEVGIASATFDERGMHVRFTDGHATTFDTEWLSREAVGVSGLPSVVAWDSSLAIPPFHAWDAVSNDDGALRAALHDFLSLGAIVVDGAPIDEDTVLVVAARFGRVRETNFGVLFDVRSVPDADDLAYTAVHLGPHTDNPYRDPVPGIQLLHCLVNETTGGDSTLVDSVAVVAQLADEDPDGVELLATIPVEFAYRDDTTDLRHARPILERDDSGRVLGLHYSPRLDRLPLLDEDRARAYQRARRRLATLLSDPRFEICFRLEPGQVEMFDNSRVLHGRTSFDPSEGHRHLQGCYIDVDEPRSRYRVLSR